MLLGIITEACPLTRATWVHLIVHLGWPKALLDVRNSLGALWTRSLPLFGQGVVVLRLEWVNIGHVRFHGFQYAPQIHRQHGLSSGQRQSCLKRTLRFLIPQTDARPKSGSLERPKRVAKTAL